MPIAGLAPVHSPLLPLDGAHLLLAVLLPFLPWDLHSVVLWHGWRHVACPAEEAQLQGAAGQHRGGGIGATARPHRAAHGQVGSGMGSVCPQLCAHHSLCGTGALHQCCTSPCTSKRWCCKPLHVPAWRCKPCYNRAPHTANPHTSCCPETADPPPSALRLQTSAQPCTTHCKPSHSRAPHTASPHILLP